MGITLAVDKIAELVSATTPKSEASRPFILVENGGSWTPDVVKNPSRGQSRNFVVRPSDLMPLDDGEAGTPAGRLTQTINIEIVYIFGQLDTARLFDLMMEDCGCIQAAIQQPLQWDCATTGIVSIAPALQSDREDLDQGDNTVGYKLTIPHPVTYREVAL